MTAPIKVPESPAAIKQLFEETTARLEKMGLPSPFSKSPRCHQSAVYDSDDDEMEKEERRLHMSSDQLRSHFEDYESTNESETASTSSPLSDHHHDEGFGISSRPASPEPAEPVLDTVQEEEKPSGGSGSIWDVPLSAGRARGGALCMNSSCYLEQQKEEVKRRGKPKTMRRRFYHLFLIFRSIVNLGKRLLKQDPASITPPRSLAAQELNVKVSMTIKEGQGEEAKPTLHQLLEETTKKLEWRPSPPRGKFKGDPAHDSDDEMSNEQRKLRDSAEKLKRVMGECSFDDGDDDDEEYERDGDIAGHGYTLAIDDDYLSKRSATPGSIESPMLPSPWELQLPGGPKSVDSGGMEPSTREFFALHDEEDDDIIRQHQAGFNDSRAGSEEAGGSRQSPAQSMMVGQLKADFDMEVQEANAQEHPPHPPPNRYDSKHQHPLQDAMLLSSDKQVVTTTDKVRSHREVTIPGNVEEDMHEVGCAAERLSEKALQQGYSGLRAIEEADDDQGKLLPTVVCRHIATCALRPDALCGSITTILVAVAEDEGLVIVKRQGSHVIAEVPIEGEGQCHSEWHWVDMQVGIDRGSKDRVLLVRFMTRLLMASGAQDTDAGLRRQRLATRRFVSNLRAKLLGSKLNKHALKKATEYKKLILDPQYLCQLEHLAREDMRKTLEANIKSLEGYAQLMETKSSYVVSLLQPMFLIYKVKLPVPPEPQPLSSYPLDLVSANEGIGKRRSRITSEEECTSLREEEEANEAKSQSSAPPSTPTDVLLDGLGCVESLKNKAWSECLLQCDTEITAQMQRKNLQVMDRLIKAYDYQRCLLQTLRDKRHLMSIPLYKTFKAHIACEQDFAHDDIEVPLYYCRSLLNGTRPATLYITYWHLIFISRLPGLSFTRSIHFRDIKGANMKTMSLAIVASAKVIELNVPLTTKQQKQQLLEEERGTAVAAGRGRGKLAFTTTSPEKVIELIRFLISLHGDGQSNSGEMINEYLESLTVKSKGMIRPNTP